MTAIIIVNFYRTYFPIFLNLEVQNTKIIKHCSLHWSMVLPNVLISNRYLDFLLAMHEYSFRWCWFHILCTATKKVHLPIMRLVLLTSLMFAALQQHLCTIFHRWLLHVNTIISMYTCHYTASNTLFCFWLFKCAPWSGRGKWLVLSGDVICTDHHWPPLTIR